MLTSPFKDQYKCSIGSERHLFVDDALVQRTRGVSKRLHQPVKHPRIRSSAVICRTRTTTPCCTARCCASRTGGSAPGT